MMDETIIIAGIVGFCVFLVAVAGLTMNWILNESPKESLKDG